MNMSEAPDSINLKVRNVMKKERATQSTMTKHLIDDLKRLISDTIIELMDCGGTTPECTHKLIAEQKPDLCQRFGKTYVVPLAESIQHTEIPKESARFQAMFRKFNRQYFGGRLPEYEVQVVFDVEFWVGKPPNDTISGSVDIDHRRIFLRLSRVGQLTTCALLDEMAYVATNGSEGSKWRSEMKRLRALGAPV